MATALVMAHPIVAVEWRRPAFSHARFFDCGCDGHRDIAIAPTRYVSESIDVNITGILNLGYGIACEIERKSRVSVV